MLKETESSNHFIEKPQLFIIMCYKFAHDKKNRRLYRACFNGATRTCDGQPVVFNVTLCDLFKYYT